MTITIPKEVLKKTLEIDDDILQLIIKGCCADQSPLEQWIVKTWPYCTISNQMEEERFTHNLTCRQATRHCFRKNLRYFELLAALDHLEDFTFEI